MKKKINKITIDTLAGMMKRGFDDLGNKLGGQIMTVANRLKVFREENAREHEAIMLRLDNVAYRFELVELQKRVEFLEKKAGIKK